MAENRKGEIVFQPLPTLSIGVVQICAGDFDSHREVAAVASEAKKQAKKIGKSSGGELLRGTVFVERRRMGNGDPRFAFGYAERTQA